MSTFPFPDTLRRFRFFLSHAGGIVGRHAEGAFHLATAEQIGLARGWSVKWMDDDDPDLGDHAYWCSEARREAAKLPGTRRGHSHEVLVAILVDSGGVTLASLSGIIEPSSGYARVIEAELVMEALCDEESAAKRDRESLRYMAL